MHRGPRPPLLASLYAVGVFAAGLVTWLGLLGWGWPAFDAAGVAAAVAIIALWSTLWAGRAVSNRRPQRRSREDGVDTGSEHNE